MDERTKQSEIMNNVWSESSIGEDNYWTYDEVIYNYLQSLGAYQSITVIPDIEFDVN